MAGWAVGWVGGVGMGGVALNQFSGGFDLLLIVQVGLEF